MFTPRPGFGPYIKRINDSLDRDANRSLRALDLTRTQCHLLMALYHQAEYTASLKELETLFQVAQPTIAGLATRLEAKELIESFPAPHDRRIKHVRLTDKGLALCLTAHEEIMAAESRLAAALSPQEQQQLLSLLQCVADSLSPDTD